MCMCIPLHGGSNGLPGIVGEKGFRFEIMNGYMRDTVINLMDDSRSSIQGGIFTVSLSFDCIDCQNRELGCGIYCDNQWGGNRDEQYCFIPLTFKILGNNHFRLERDTSRQVVTNSTASAIWIESSEDMKAILYELCDRQGWYIECKPARNTELSELILIKASSPDKRLYSSYLSR